MNILDEINTIMSQPEDKENAFVLLGMRGGRATYAISGSYDEVRAMLFDAMVSFKERGLYNAMRDAADDFKEWYAAQKKKEEMS